MIGGGKPQNIGVIISSIRETETGLFFEALTEKNSARIQLATMDIRKPFWKSVLNNASTDLRTHGKSQHYYCGKNGATSIYVSFVKKHFFI